MSDQDKSDNNSFRKKDRPVSRFNRAEKKEKINSMKNNNSLVLFFFPLFLLAHNLLILGNLHHHPHNISHP